MDRRFSASTTPLLAGVVKERTPEAAIEKIRYFEENGATAIDLHLSCLDDEYKTVAQIKRIVDCTELPMLGLNYSRRYDWTEIEETEEERAELLMKSVEAGISAVDLLGYSFDPQSRAKFVGEDVYSFTKNNPLEIVTDKAVIEKQKEFIHRVHGMGKEVLLSTHPDIPMNGEQVIDLVLFLAERNPDIIKIVTRCNTEEELIEAAVGHNENVGPEVLEARELYNELYQKYFPNGGASIFTFEIKGGVEQAHKFIDSLQIFSLLANVADAKSLVIHPATTTHSQLTEEELADQGIKPNTIRLSIGVEHIDDILADLQRGFDAVK